MRLTTGAIPIKESVKGAKKYRFLLLPIFIVAIIFLSALLVLKPKIGDILTKRRALSDQKKQLAELMQKLAALEGLNEYELAAKVERVLKILPAEKAFPGGLVIIRHLVQSMGLELVDVKVDPGAIFEETSQSQAKARKETPFLTYHVIVNGSQEAIKDFLGELVSVAPLVRIEKVAVSAGEGGTAEVGVELNIFYLSLPPTITSVGTPLPKITPEEDKTYEGLASIKPFELETHLTPISSGKENPFAL